VADIMAEIEELKKKLGANPDSMIFVPLADAYRKSGLHKEAIDTCKAGLEKHPTYTSARVVLGRIYSEKEMLDEAIEELKRVEAVDVDNIMVHLMLGNVYLKKQLFPNAVEQFQRVLSLNPDDTETQEKLREALSAKQNAPAAAEPAPQSKPEPVISPEPAAPAAPSQKQDSKIDVQKSLKVAELYVKKEEFEKAIEVYREILDLDSENIIVQQRLREVYDLQEKKHKKQQAINEKKKDFDTDKITAEDILDVMKNAVENDSVDEPAPSSKKPETTKEDAKKEEQPKQETKAAKVEETKKEEPTPAPAAKEEPRKEEEPKPEAKSPRKEEKPSEDTKKEDASKENVAKEAEIDDNKKKLVQEILKGMTEVDGIVGSFYILRTGKIVASVLPPKINAGEIENLVASIVEKTEMSVKNMNQGKLNQVVIASESGQLLFTEISKGVLFMIGDANINVGKMGLTLKSTIEKMKKVL